MDQKSKRRYVVTKQKVDQAEKQWTELVKVNNKYDIQITKILAMVDRYKTMWDAYFAQISVWKRSINMESINAVSIHITLCNAWPPQSVLIKEVADPMLEADVAELGIAE